MQAPSTTTKTIGNQVSTPYLAYSYSYPHKTAYRDLTPAVNLSDIWADEKQTALFLYLHIPFCEMRCGFCNLFAASNPGEDLISSYLGAIERQAAQVAQALGPAKFARMAWGGGTPTFLSAQQLERLFLLTQEYFGADASKIPTSVETSPMTATPERLAVLKQYGASRISIGVQSFDDNETSAIGRAQRKEDVLTALNVIRASGVKSLNIDLIYGIPGQTQKSWKYSIEQALDFQPEEVYLYPLYVRPLTGLSKNLNQTDGGEKLNLYRMGRDYLLNRGYRQISMRMFESPRATDAQGPVYCCQTDGMVGIGCGARSYTTKFHYANRYAVSQKPIKSIIEQYIASDDMQFSMVDFGIKISEDEQKRRFILQSLFQTSGLDISDFEKTFPQSILLQEFPKLKQLMAEGFAVSSGGIIKLTPEGLELSDQLGVHLYSDFVQRRMHEATVL